MESEPAAVPVPGTAAVSNTPAAPEPGVGPAVGIADAGAERAAPEQAPTPAQQLAAVPGEPAEAGVPVPPPPAASPLGTSAAPDTAPGAASLADVQRAWPEALGALKGRLRAMAKEATPVRVEGNRVVLGLPAKFGKVHLPTIEGEAASVAAALGARLGVPVTVAVELDDQAPARPLGAGAAPPEPDDEDFGEVYDPPGARAGGRLDSPVELAINAFGATVESEHTRD